MIGDALEQPDEIAVVVAERGGSRQQRDLGERRELAHDSGEPRSGIDTIDRRVTADEAAAEHRILVAQHDSGAGMRGGASGGEARGTRADHEHVAMPVLMLVGIGIRLARGAAHARGMADQVLVAKPPLRRRRPHERLVVEAGRNEP